MFFNRRRKYCSDIEALLATFGIDINEAGVIKVAGIVDHAWDDDYSVYEAALVVAYGFAYGLYEKKEVERADRLAQDRLKPIQAEWIRKGIVRAELMTLFAKRLEERMAMARKS